MNNKFFSLAILLIFFSILISFTLHFGNIFVQVCSGEEVDIELFTKSKKKIVGHLKNTDTFFSSEDIDDNIIETDVIIKNKHINIKVGYGKRVGEIHILGKDIYTDEIIKITDDEADIFKQNLESMLRERVGTNKVEKQLIRTFNLLYSWPSSFSLALDPDEVTIPEECGIIYPDGISENICPMVNEQHIGRYATEGEYCGWAKYSGVPALKLDRPTAWMENVEHSVGGNNCFGRCGRGCIGDGPPNNAINIYTQDCFDHDLCAENEGTLDAECNWMFMYCIDDFFYGPICPSLDLIFVIDTTGSMWDDIASVKASATEIVNILDSEISDYRVAVVDYRDFPVSPYGGGGDYPYHVNLPFSTDKNAIINAIQNLSLGYGADWEESVYSGLIRAIYTEGLTPWREGVEKVVILMGDAPPHDPEPFTGYTSSSVVAAASSVDPAKIYSISIGGDPTTYSYFAYLAEQTEGEVFTSPTAEDIVEVLLEVIHEIINSPPDCSRAVPSISQVWPPDHRKETIQILNVEDPDGDPVSMTITGITQDEPIVCPGSGDTYPDGGVIGDDTVWVRAERSGISNSRVYNISFTASDDKDAQCSGSVLVCVPHDQGINTVCVDDGQLYDSLNP